MKNPNGPSREETDDWKDELAARDAERAQVKQQWCATCNVWCDHGTWQHGEGATTHESIIDNITKEVLSVVSQEGYEEEEWVQVREAVAKGMKPTPLVRSPSEIEMALNYYRSAQKHERPEYVPAQVRLTKRVVGIMGTVAEAGHYECESNQWGAISVCATNGKRLGVKPCEFEAIGWRPNNDSAT